MKKWSKLQKEIYKLISPEIRFQIHCAAYPMRTQRGASSVPRYWVTLGKEIIFDYPKDFKKEIVEPFILDVTDISNLIREYIDSPIIGLFEKVFDKDRWGLTDILKASDRRIGKEKLKLMKGKTNSEAVISIIELRLKKSGNT